MSLQADVFDPEVVRAALKGAAKTTAEKERLNAWKSDVRAQLTSLISGD